MTVSVSVKTLQSAQQQLCWDNYTGGGNELGNVTISNNICSAHPSMEARTSFQCWGGGGTTETVPNDEDSFIFPNNLVKGGITNDNLLKNDVNVNSANNNVAPVLHLSLESLSQMQELYYSYQDCLRNAYSM